MVINCFYLFLYIIESVIANIYFSDNFEKKLNIPLTFITGVPIYLIGFAVNLISNNSIALNLITFFLINIIFAKILYSISFKSAIFHSAILLAIMFASELVVESFLVSVFNLNLDAYRNNIQLLIVCGIINKLIYLTICKVLSYIFSYKKLNSSDLKMFPALLLYPIMSTITLSLLSYASITYEFSRNLNAIYVSVSILSLAFSCFVFIFYGTIQVKEKELINLQSEKQKNEINKTFYEMLEKKNNDQRLLAHDIKHHFSAINSMDDIESVRNYLSKVQTEFEKYQYIGKSDNKMLDLILSKYSHICSVNGIDFFVDIRASNLEFIDDNDLVSLLGNLLDNAVEAATGVDNASIKFYLKSDEYFEVLSLINSSSRKPETRGNNIITSKSDASFHGFGIKSIEKTVKKYNGECEWIYDDIKKEFHFNIIFNRKSGSAR